MSVTCRTRKPPLHGSLYAQVIVVPPPGAGMNVNPASLDAAAVAQYAGPGKMQTTTEFLLHVIPTTVVDAFARGEILQVLLFVFVVLGAIARTASGSGSSSGTSRRKS